jgi:hypothetical protein
MLKGDRTDLVLSASLPGRDAGKHPSRPMLLGIPFLVALDLKQA